MFDNIKYEADCPECGTRVIVGWQSKDGPCDLETLRPEQVRGFYTSCPKCKAWLEATVKVLTYRIDVTATPFAQEEKEKENET